MGIAELAILFKFHFLGIFFLIFGCSIIALFAFRTRQGNTYSHHGTSILCKKILDYSITTLTIMSIDVPVSALNMQVNQTGQR
jgi:hypothetical protein